MTDNISYFTKFLEQCRIIVVLAQQDQRNKTILHCHGRRTQFHFTGVLYSQKIIRIRVKTKQNFEY